MNYKTAGDMFYYLKEQNILKRPTLFMAYI